ncbi:MAG: NADH-quinone oxidoreductase subunit C [Proteobacteria bacterium]|nr:NADH-quinone oxidoreductase subunit C [Pseudomonadota bacterium]
MTTATPHLDAHLDVAGLEALRGVVAKAFPKAQVAVVLRELTVVVEAGQIPEVLGFLRDSEACKMTMLMDLCGVDYLGHVPAQPARFAVVYHLLSLEKNVRVRVKCFVAEGQDGLATVPSVVGIYPSAAWYEREAYDMFGIVFVGNPDLRRILTDYDFVGFPLRKDFPLEGHVEVYYDAKQKRVAYKPVDLPQEFRHFDGVSGWRGMTGNAKLAEEDAVFAREEFK